MTTWTLFCHFLTTTYLYMDISNPEGGQQSLNVPSLRTKKHFKTCLFLGSLSGFLSVFGIKFVFVFFPNTDSKAFVSRTVCYDVVGLGCTCQEMSSIIAVSIHVRQYARGCGVEKAICGYLPLSL